MPANDTCDFTKGMHASQELTNTMAYDFGVRM